MARRPSASTQDLIDDLQIKCIGLITAEWALLEATASLVIWDFCGLDRRRGLCVTADLGSIAKIKMLSAMAQVHFQAHSDAADALKRFLELTAELETLNTQRNCVVHNIWNTTLPDQMRSKRMSTKGGKLIERPMTKSTTELMDLYTKITAARARLDDFHLDYALQPPSRPK